MKKQNQNKKEEGRNWERVQPRKYMNIHYSVYTYLCGICTEEKNQRRSEKSATQKCMEYLQRGEELYEICEKKIPLYILEIEVYNNTHKNTHTEAH